MTRLTIEISDVAWSRLLDLAMIERRSAREQAGWLVEAGVGLRHAHGQACATEDQSAAEPPSVAAGEP